MSSSYRIEFRCQGSMWTNEHLAGTSEQDSTQARPGLGCFFMNEILHDLRKIGSLLA